MIARSSTTSPPPRTSRRIGAVSRLAAVVAILPLVATLAGCGGDDTADASADATVVAVPADSDALNVECPEPDPQDQLAVFEPVVIGTAVNGDVMASCMVLADERGLRAQGLMSVTDLGPFVGMLFAYAESDDGGYWMRNTPMPLSIAWVSADGEVVATADMEPCMDPAATCPSSAPGAEYRWAVEVPQGGLAELGLVEGARMDVSAWPVGVD